MLTIGCSRSAPPKVPPAKSGKKLPSGESGKSTVAKSQILQQGAGEQGENTRGDDERSAPPPRSKAAPPVAERTFSDLIASAEAAKATPLDPMRFPPPEVDEAKAAGRGIRKLVGTHLTLYTDLPSAPAVDELPRVFDLAVAQWLEYFAIDAQRAKSWHMIGVCAQEKERFFDTGLWPADLPPFLHGYMRDNQFWLYEQPSDYYRRHLVLHEGTHGFMWAFLGGLGPPWYNEGMAELLGTHRWSDGKLELNIVPTSREDSLLWGRVKVVRDAWSQGSAMSLPAIMHYPPNAHLRTEPYAWCWAAAVFFDHDPQFQTAFRKQSQNVADVSDTFSERMLNGLPQPREQIVEQWQCYVANLDYGYDVPRESIVRKPAVALPDDEGQIELLADRGWQSSGWQLAPSVTYVIEASGQFQIGQSTKPWISEANGITLCYYRSRPIGQLLAAVTDEGASGGKTPLVEPSAIGVRGEITPEKEGVLYLRMNDSPNSLADNAGKLIVRVRRK